MNNTKQTQWERCVEEAIGTAPTGISDKQYKHAADLYAMRFIVWMTDKGRMFSSKTTQQLLEQFNNQEQ